MSHIKKYLSLRPLFFFHLISATTISTSSSTANSDHHMPHSARHGAVTTTALSFVQPYMDLLSKSHCTPCTISKEKRRGQRLSDEGFVRICKIM